MAVSSKRSLPPWSAPAPSADPPALTLYNSLTRRKDTFIPSRDRRVLWYSCGPTVYDSSHMGHARSYVSFDILRRVLTDYFGYDVTYCMNITDIDDKIIKRARQTHLWEKYIQAEPSLRQLEADVPEALKIVKTKLESETDPCKRTMLTNFITLAETALATKNVTEIISRSRDVLVDWLEVIRGSSVEDNTIFSALPRHFENEFHQDMDALNILPPDVITRVSEYIPEIVGYIEKIIENGYAYEAGGSVYFDTGKFDTDPNHHYAKLVPEAFGDCSALNEGEGELCISQERLAEKRSPNDFALWKASKPGEPRWDSPWGKGRPGWHIECSVMASSILGDTLDIHTGGYDLKFPHHDNELAQAEAYYGSDSWVNYFLHTGHLTIAGCKMSKSLKNFITIREALKRNSARQIRFAFLLHSWKDTLDYSPATMEHAVAYEKAFVEFFLNIKDALRGSSKLGPFYKWGPAEKNLHQKYDKARNGVHKALCDNVDTKSAVDQLRELVSAANVYLREKASSQGLVDPLSLRNVAAYITRILAVFGCLEEDTKIGLSERSSGTVNTEDVAMPYVLALSEFREHIRQAARKQKASEILEICDKLRDDVLPPLGVRLEDREGSSAAVKLVDPEILLKEREAKLQVEREKQAEKERKKRQLEQIQASKDAQRKIPPSEIFRSETDKYSAFDEKGFPTHDIDGKEISKGQLKKLQKRYQEQEKRYNQYISSGGGDAVNGAVYGAST